MPFIGNKNRVWIEPAKNMLACQSVWLPTKSDNKHRPAYELKCIFVHIPKTGGTSIESALGLLGDLRHENTETMFGEITSPALKKRIRSKGFLQHLKAKELRRLLPCEFNGYFRFAFVRNPWSRMVSLYHFHIGDKRFSFDEFVRSMTTDLHRSY